MAKIQPLADVGSLANTTAARATINNNSQKIEDAFQNTLSRDGSAPNQMEADFDLNDHYLLNVADPVNEADGVNLRSVRPLVEQFASEIVETAVFGTQVVDLFVASAGQFQFPLSEPPGSIENISVFVDGIALRPSIDFFISGPALQTLTLPSPLVGGETVNIRYAKALPSGITLSEAVTYTSPSTGVGGTVKSFLDSLWSTGANAGAKLINWIQSGAGAVARTVEAKLRERPSVLDYIPVAEHAGILAGTSAYDCTAAFNAALTEHGVVHVPAGTYRLLGEVTLAAGKYLVGAGRRKVFIDIRSTFSLAADGVFKFSAPATGGGISGMTVLFEQPDSAVLGDYTQYPPAIYAVNCQRFKVHDFSAFKAWDGIDMKGNTGGAVLDDIELSMFNVGIDIDGALDSVKLSRIHLWPFSLTANQRTHYTNAYGIKCARCDDFKLTNSLIFSLINGAYFYTSASGSVIGTISNVDFDDRGGLVIGGGAINASSCLFTQGKNDARLIHQTGGVLTVSNSRLRGDVINSSANGFIEIAAGEATFTGCWMSPLNNDKQFVYWTNAAVNLVGNRFNRTAGVVYTSAMLRASTNATGTVVGNSCNSLAAGSGKLAQIDADNGLVITGNHSNNWTVQTPSGALTNTRVTNNSGAGAEKDQFCGYFSGDATTTVRLPSGWTVGRAGAGNYTVTHNLSLAAVTDLLAVAVSGVAGTTVVSDTAGGSVNSFKLRVYDAAGVPVDGEVQFIARRYLA